MGAVYLFLWAGVLWDVAQGLRMDTSIAGVKHSNVGAHTQTHVDPDPVWTSMRRDAEIAIQKEPLLVSFLHSTILSQEWVPASVCACAFVGMYQCMCVRAYVCAHGYVCAHVCMVMNACSCARAHGYVIYSMMCADTDIAHAVCTHLYTHPHTMLSCVRSLESALAFHMANKLASPAMIGTQIQGLFIQALQDRAFQESLRLDLLAVKERDPACRSLPEVLLYFKGFQALQAHRAAHCLWIKGRDTLAYFIQSQVLCAYQYMSAIRSNMD
jgi:hypothetical protein